MASLSPHSGPVAASAAGGTAAQHFHPPTPRELRAQAVHRLQIGVLGLAAMLLLVGLANIIMDRARAGDGLEAGSAASLAGPAQVGGDPTPAGDPLADIGVVPDLPDGEAPAASRSPAAENSPPR